MNVADALRKIRLLRKVTPENGYSDAEAEAAVNLSQLLLSRFSIRPEDLPRNSAPSFALSWVYWEQLMGEFGLELRRFARRGSVSLYGGKLAFIKLHTGEWWVQRMSGGGCEVVARDYGVESMREYLKKNGMRPQTFLRR